MKNIWIFLLILFFSPVFAQYQTDVICAGFTSPCLGNSPSWKYWDQGFTMPDSANWKTLTTYNTASWGTGNAPLGYDFAGVPLTPPRTTTIGYGSDLNNKYRTSYFRKIITLSGYLDGGDTLLNNYPAAIYKLRVRRDDGIIVYMNGRMVYRDGLVLPCGFYTYAIPSAPDNGNDWQEIYVDPHIFHIGDNIVAVELHQSSNSSNDLFFDLELKALRTLPFTQNTIIRNTESWKYLHDNSDPGATWKNVGFVDTGPSWLTGVGEFGFGEGDETTIINAGFITTYFRKTFNITSLDDFYRLRMRRDDGIVIYINGVETFRENFNTYETIAKTTLASNAEDDGNVWNEIFLKNTGFVVGQNTIAVEIHQVSTGSSDLSFFFEMIGMKTAATFVTRGPYLQRAAPTSIKVMWNTSVASIGQVKYGTDPTNLSSTSSPTPSAIDHNVTLTGLTPNTKYYYSVETNTTILERTSDNLFITPPTTGTEKKTRIWAMGCFGSGKLPQRQVQERFLEQVHNNYVDMFLQLGDIAYVDGSESDFQKNYFQVYQNYRTIKQTPIYNALGNHEYCNGTCYGNFAGIASANIFENFTAAEAGGVASGTERYYSFNHGNIHVISIDAFGTEPTTNFHIYDAGSLQKQWLINDLAANTQKWTIVIVHAPPYSKGKHDSDNPPAPGHNTEPEMIGVRSLVPLFDQYNVDLVLGSHSHNYERSKLIKNHTGNSDSFIPATHEVIGTNGKYDGTALSTCLYNKQTANKGTVYAVVGSGGRLETGVSSPWPHPAMTAAYDVTVQGSYLIEIEGSRMDVSWVTIDDVLINSDPSVKDRFTMMKDINLTAETVPVAIGIPTLTLTAPWSGTFMWSNGATTQSITVAVTNTSYTVTDYSIACLSKTFTITTCPTINTLTNPITSGVLKYEVSQTLTATNIISSGVNVSYDAGKAIFLNAGFKVDSGGIFKAYIDGCGNF